MKLRPRVHITNTISGASALALALVCAVAGSARAQQLIGYVSTHDAEVTGASDVVDGHAVLAGSVSVTAKDHTAPITLGRGGTVRVCQTSVVHLTESRAAELAAPLLFSLDRGAIEVQMNATPADAVMTPDLRFAVHSGGPLDLRLRVARNGDTCVENRGAGAPTLTISDVFGESTYEVQPNQRVLFEHGSLREVVDHESSPCGCPDAEGMSIADALLAPAALPGAKPAPEAAKAAAEHPFPAAVSEGLAPVPEVPQAAAGEVHTQVSDALTYTAPAIAQPSDAQAGAQAGGATVAQAGVGGSSRVAGQAAAAPTPPVHDLVHVVGRFFRRIFGHG